MKVIIDSLIERCPLPTGRQALWRGLGEEGSQVLFLKIYTERRYVLNKTP